MLNKSPKIKITGDGAASVKSADIIASINGQRQLVALRQIRKITKKW